jgi:regulator of replication initiation timing
MELRERLFQSAVWCDAKDDLHERVKHIAQDLRDAAAEIEGQSSNVRRLHNENYGLRCKVESLEEQLLIAKTSSSDSDSFRERDKRDAANLMAGLRMAIHTMAEALKGVQR